MNTIHLLIHVLMLVILSIALGFRLGARFGNRSMRETIESQKRIIANMDRTIRAQWEVQQYLYKRLGEPGNPPPVSLTGLPDPEDY